MKLGNLKRQQISFFFAHAIKPPEDQNTKPGKTN